MPLNNRAIRIIKREERTDPLTQSETPTLTAKTEKQDHREILKTVTLWIEQQREKKQLELRTSFELYSAAD